jgi:hypothetical protein
MARFSVVILSRRKAAKDFVVIVILSRRKAAKDFVVIVILSAQRARRISGGSVCRAG